MITEAAPLLGFPVGKQGVVHKENNDNDNQNNDSEQ